MVEMAILRQTSQVSQEKKRGEVREEMGDERGEEMRKGAWCASNLINCAYLWYMVDMAILRQMFQVGGRKGGKGKGRKTFYSLF